MGKRSDFERVERDFYPTPESAVLPLLPFLKKDMPYIEPCAGNGQLIDILAKHGITNLEYACDIEPQRDDIAKQDIFELSYTISNVITNPAWDRKILHPLIEHLLKNIEGDIWLLFDADWMHTKQSKYLIKWCSKIVSVGRVKWIPDSKCTGKDNCCWYCFNRIKPFLTEFYGR